MRRLQSLPVKSAPTRMAWALLLGLPILPAAQLRAQGEPPRVRDSAGVRIVEHATLKVSNPAFTVRPKLLGDVGGLRDDPSEEIEGRTGGESAVRFADGRIAVAEMYTVRVLRPNGSFVQVIGSRGGGPGQFDSPVNKLCLLRGDTLLVRAGRRIVVFDSTGGHVRTTAAEGVADGNCRDDGTMISGLWSSRQPVRGPQVDQPVVQLRHLSRDGRVLAAIGEFPGTIGRGGPGKLIHDAFSVGIAPRLLFADNGSRAEIKAYSATGKLLQIIRWRDPLIPTTPAMLRAFALRMAPTNLPVTARTEYVQDLLEGPQRTALPAYLSFFVDRAARVWVRHYPTPPPAAAGPPTWTIFAEDGRLLGRFIPPQLPRGSRAEVVDAANDFVVLRIQTPEEGVRVVVQAIEAAGATTGR